MALVLVGSQTEGAGANQVGSGTAFAFPFTAKNTGLLSALSYKTSSGASGTGTSVRLAICADAAGKPGAVLGSEVVVTPGTVNTTLYEATGVNAEVVTGTKYWLVILSIGGTTRLKTGNSTEESAAYKVTSATTITGASGWVASTVVGGPVYFAGLGVVTIAAIAGRGGGGGSASTATVRQIALVEGHGGGEGTAATPASKGVQLARGRGGGSGSATISTTRSIALVAGRGGGGGAAIPPSYGNAEVFGYGQPSIWRVVQPMKAATPGSPVIIFLHESSSDEPSVVEAPTKLPKVGETLFAIRPVAQGGNGKQLSTTNYAEDAVANGFCCFVPAYRPIAEGGAGTPGYQFSQADVEALIAWVKQHAEAWNGDPSKVCIIGGSFGVTIGLHEALKLNSERGARYIVAAAGLSGPIDIPSRVQGRDEEVAAKEAWEAAHPGFTELELVAWETEHKYATTDIVPKLAQYIGVSGANLKEPGWLKGPSAEQKAALKLAEELSPFYNLATMSATMPYLWYAVSKEDLTPQQQGEEMSEAAAEHGQPGKYHFDAAVVSGHAFTYYTQVKAEIYAYFRQAINPSVVAAVVGHGGGAGSASTSTTRTLALVAGHGGGLGSATVPQTVRVALAAGRGGGEGSALVATTRTLASVAGRGGGLGAVSITRPAVVGRGGGSGSVLVQTIRSTVAVGHGGGRGSATAKGRVVLFPSNAPVAGHAIVAPRGRIAG